MENRMGLPFPLRPFFASLRGLKRWGRTEMGGHLFAEPLVNGGGGVTAVARGSLEGLPNLIGGLPLWWTEAGAQ